MFNEHQTSGMRNRFWIVLGQYLAPIPSVSGQKVNWINYKTGIKEIRLKMDALKQEAFVAIEIKGSDEQRSVLYAMFESFKSAFPEQYVWEEEVQDERGGLLSRISVEMQGYSIYKEEHWPHLISFFKSQVIFFDRFWAENKEIFEMAV